MNKQELIEKIEALPDNIGLIQTLVNMHQFGYEVEKEKWYKVRMKYIENNMKYIVFGKYSESWFLESENESSNVRTIHTRKQLEEAGFGWVFDCEGIEVKEVE